MAIIEAYEVPGDLYYTKDHAWVKIEGEKIRIGVTDFMQKMAGEITFIRLPRPGKDLETDKTLISLQSGKWAGKILSPVAGRILEINKDLAANPAPLNTDPYGQGWVATMTPRNMADVAGLLLFGEEAVAFLHEEIKRTAGLKK